MDGWLVAAVVSAGLFMASAVRAQWRPPEVAQTRKAFEAAYPKTSVSGAALELEALSARLGIDLAPREEGRNHPDPETAKALQPGIVAAGKFVDHELENPDERLGAPGEKVGRFLSENETTIDAISGIALGRRPIDWEVDVLKGVLGIDASYNVLGHVRLQRVLAAFALTQARRKDTDAALQTAEAMWRLCESIASRPDMISSLMVLNDARVVVGLLRKIDAPAFEWSDRLRGRGFYEAFLASFQNGPWATFAADPEPAPEAEDSDAEEFAKMLRGFTEGRVKIYRRFAESLADRSPCDWTREGLQQAWDVAASGESPNEQIIAGMQAEAVEQILIRWRRFLIDAELTALVLEARGEKAASRQGEWPARLANLESSVCPGQFYSYQRSRGITLAFEGHVSASEHSRLTLPLSFRGAPRPTPTPTSPTPVLTPTPPAHTLPP